MGWVNDKFFYTKRLLRVIVQNYSTIYDGLPLSLSEEVTNPWALAEYKADFDMALKGIGKGEWSGQISGCRFKEFKGYGRLQQIIIADILNIDERQLVGLGFWDIPRLRGYAYYLMCQQLNGGNYDKDGILNVKETKC